MNKNIQIGDWVNSYSKGIYRIEKIIERYYDESEQDILGKNKIGDKHKEKIVITKRLLNSKFKKSISYESCSEHFVSPLSKQQFSELQKVLKDDPTLLADLNDFKIPTIINIYNSDLQIDNKEDLQIVLQLINFIKKGKTFLEIEKEMNQLNILRLKPKHFGNYKFQLFNFDYEYIKKRKIWRDAKLIKQ